MTTQYLVADTSANGWEQTIYAFLAEKERRSGSIRTVQSYSRGCRQNNSDQRSIARIWQIARKEADLLA